MITLYRSLDRAPAYGNGRSPAPNITLLVIPGRVSEASEGKGTQVVTSAQRW